MTQDSQICPTCKGALTQKDQTKLVLVGILMLFESIAGLFFWWVLRVISILMLLSAAYLLLWAWLGQGLWCRQCKKFPILRKEENTQ